MKKKIIIGAAIAVAVIAVVVAAILIFKAPPMLTHPIEEVKSVTITVEPYAQGANQSTELHQKADMYTTYRLVENSVNCKKIGPFNEGMAHDPAYEIIFTYADGTSDRIFASGDEEYILRCINPDAMIEKQKFVKGRCPDMEPYIAMWLE